MLSEIPADGVRSVNVTLSNIMYKALLIRRGNVVQFVYNSNTYNTAAGELGTVGTIPEGFRPTTDLQFNNNGNGANPYMNFHIYPNGNVTAYNYGSAIIGAAACRFNAMWITADD